MTDKIALPAFTTVAGFTAYLWDHALTMLRLAEPIRIAGLSLLHGTDEQGIYPDLVSQADIVVIQRDFPRWFDRYKQVLEHARADGKPVVFEIDDLLFALPENHPDRPIHYYTPALLPMLRAMIEADAVTTSTPALVDLLRVFNPNIWLLPNYLDDQLWEITPPVEKPTSWPVVIGYMGSDTHQPDLDAVAPALRNLLNSYETKLILRFWGGEPPQALRLLPNVEWIPVSLRDYAQYADFFARQECDIFIAPLIDNLFNRCKSPIKFLEYSSHGTPGVFSKIAPYEGVVVHGENGFLACTLEEWEGALSQLIDSPSLRYKMGLNASKTLTNNWLLSAHAHEWREVYATILAQPRSVKVIQNESLVMLAQLASPAHAWEQALLKEINLWKDQVNQPIHADRDFRAMEDQTCQLQDQIDQMADINQDLHRQVDEKDRRLQELSTQLNGWYQSKAGRMARGLWRLHLALIPPGSIREKLWQAVWQQPSKANKKTEE